MGSKWTYDWNFSQHNWPGTSKIPLYSEQLDSGFREKELCELKKKRVKHAKIFGSWRTKENFFY